MIKQKSFIYFILIVAAIIALLLYNPWLLYFQNDDMVHIPLSRDGVLLQHNSFRPICDISMMLDYKLYGKNAAGYHFTNLLLHIINSALVFFIMKLFLKKYLTINEINLHSFITAVLFWIFMNHSEAVFWILGRSAMLGMVFFLPAVIFYFYRASSICFLLCMLFYLLALLSYESTIILPVVFFLISFSDVKSKNSSWKIERRFLIAILIAFIIYCCCRIYFMGFASNYYNNFTNNNISLSFIVGSFCRLIIRSWLPPSQSEFFLIAAIVILLIIIITLFVRLYNKNKNVIIALFIIWCISLLPYVTLSIDSKGVESERFLYLPSLFICIIISVFLIEFKPALKISLIIIICSINTILLYQHAMQYRFCGRVVANTINAVNRLKNKKILYADNIPEENFGALIFRSGFSEGINWLKNKGTVDSIAIISQSKHNLPFQKNYRTIFSNNLSLMKESLKNSFTLNDVYFLYTDSALYVINANNRTK